MTDVTLGYAYGNGRLSAMTRTANGLGQTYNMAYDGFGKLTAVQVGTRSLAGYTYAANDGLLTQMTYGNGNTVAYDYDDLERVKNIYYNNSSSPAYTYTYKGEGTLGQLTDNNNNRTYAYTYDSLGRLNGLTEQFGGASVQTFSASYDTANRPTNVTYAVSPSWNGTLGSNRVYTYTYSANDGSLTSMTGPGASMAYTYDGLKRLMKRVVSSGSSEVVTRNYSYLAGSGSNTSPLVSGLTANHGSTNLFSGNYSYDSVGNITAITGSAPASYTYDSQNQLLTEVRDGTTYTYTYDAAGNMLSKTKTSGSGTDTFTYGNAEWRDLLTAYNGNAITYDTVGNPTTWYDGATMTWVNGKRLASISATNSHSALAFTYDVDGLRLTKTVGTGSSAVEHKYTWQGGKLIAEYDGTNTLEFFYDESGAPYALSYNGTTYYYVTNLQGDVVKVVNASGTSQAEYSYNAWGQVISAAGTLAAVNPIRYRGYYYDVETGLYYLKSRYYDPQICRFINADSYASTGQGFAGCNMFAYCNNNPVNGADPSGMESLTGVWAGGMSWLPLIDGPIPVGDIIYLVGLGCCGITDYVNYVGADNIAFALANYPNQIYDCINSFGGSSPANPPPNGPDFREFTSRNYRYNLQQYTGQNGKGMQAHHVLPQEFRDLFQRANINIDNPRYGSWVNSAQHQGMSYEYNQDWRAFFEEFTNATGPSVPQIEAFARELAGKYGFEISF